MTHVACAVAAPASAALTRPIIRELSRAAGSPPNWLHEYEAVELSISSDDLSTRTKDLRTVIEGLPIDLGIVPAAGGRKRLLLSDMDSTMITIECVDELAAVAGVGEQVAAITRRAMAGELDFAGALVERVRLLEGLSVDAVDTIFRDTLALMPGARTVVQTMRSAGCRTVLVSGGFTLFTERVAAMIGYDAHYGNRLEVVDGRVTGRLIPPVGGETAKLELLREQVSRLAIDAADVVAVGDGANDRAMLEAAGLGCAFRAKPVLERVADVTIRHADLTALLYLQGYTAAEFAAERPG